MEGQRDVEGSRSERHVVAFTPPGEKTLHPDGVIGETPEARHAGGALLGSTLLPSPPPKKWIG